MTDRLGEALADYWTTNNGNRSYKADVAIYEAARSWRALTNPTDELIERLSVALKPLEVFTAEDGLRAIRPRESAAIVRAVLDALSDTAGEEE